MRKLKLLLAACALLGGELSANAYQTPVADGIYYLYNTACTDGTPGFMSTGNGYGFQVVIDKFGFPVKLIDAGNGNFQFQFIHHNGYLSDDSWMYSDGGTDRARTITIQDQGDGNYKLLNTNNSKEIEDWYGNVVGDGEGNRHNYLWKFLSKAERDAIVAGYTTSVKLAAATSMGMPASVDTEEEFDDYLNTNYIGVDQSAKITNGTFTTEHNTADWSTTSNSNREFNIGWGNNDPKDTPEIYEGAGYLTHTTITVDKVGLYKVSVNAFYRCGNGDNNNRIGELGYDGSVAYLKANDNISKVCDWYSGKINGNGPSSPSVANSTYFSAGKYMNEVYVYVGDAKTIDISLHSHAFTWGGWLVFNNFKLTYYSDEVSDEDATAILATATTLESQIMKASVLSALSSAKTTFNGARTIANYNALSTAISDAETSVTAYSNAKAYLDEVPKILSGTNVYTAAAYAEKYTTPKSKYDARTLTNEEGNALKKTVTSYKTANTVDDILLSAWTIGGEPCKDYDKSLYINTWSSEGNNDGSNFRAPFFEYWASDANSVGATTMEATVSGLTGNATYVLSALVRVRQTNDTTKVDNSIKLQVGSGSTVDVTQGTQIGSSQFYVKKFTAKGNADANGNLSIKFIIDAESNISWFSFKDVYYDVPATDEQKTALAAAITTAEAKTLGFDDGEYAPYNNVDGCVALAVAKEIDPETASSPVVVAATSALTGATWTANTTEVNAFYDGDFSIQAPKNDGTNGTAVLGWTKNNSIRTLPKSDNSEEAIYKATSGHSGMYVWNGSSATYGETAGYTMPLNAHTIYEFTYKRASWSGKSSTHGNFVVKQPDGTAVCNLSEDAQVPDYNSTDGEFITQSGLFVTGDAGNYTVVLNNWGNTVFTDLSITKAASQVLEFADGSVPTYAPGTYPTVKISRTLTAGNWSTAVYPFAVSGVDKIAVLDSYEDGKLNFISATSSEANKPFMMRSNTDKSEITLNNVEVSAAVAVDVEKNGASLKGVYTTTDIDNTALNYVLSENKIYKVGTAGATINPYRAYIQIAEGGESRLTFTVDGETTAIEGVAADKTMDGTIYNLNGQRVKTAKKGVYVVNGKAVIVK